MRPPLRTPLRAAVAAVACSLLGAAAPAGAPRNAEILWDRWGVPHIHARSEPDLFYAFGWAQARSHGDLLLRMYGQTRGRGAEYWGERYLDGDRVVRAMGVPGRAAEWHAAQSPRFRRNLDAFAEGINAFARVHGDSLSDSVAVVLPVTGTDVLAHLQRVVHLSFVGNPQAAAAAAGPAPAARGGSNAWAVAPRRSASGRALLLANPHLSWSGIHTWYEAQLTGPGVDAYGAALVGFPFLAIAFNDRLGWTHTVNTYDGADLYELTLQDGGYRWEGGVRAFEESRETVRVRLPDGTFRDEPLRVRRSVHGPVLREGGGKAYAYRLAGLDAPGMVEQYWGMARSRSLGEFEAAVRRLQMPMFTIVYADRDGHVMHLYNGRVPVRASGGWGDWRGTVRGDTSATLWTRVHPYADLPRVLDPPSGWVQNANDPPWTATLPAVLRADDYPLYLAPRDFDLRPQRSAGLLMADSSITLEEMVAYQQSAHAELADRVMPDLLRAARAAGDSLLLRAADVLERWDRSMEPESRGAVLFYAWSQDFWESVPGGGGPFATPWSADEPVTTPRGLADPAAAVGALRTAAARLQQQAGALDVPWGAVFRLRRDGVDLPARGGPDELGIFPALWFRRASDGRFTAVGGDSYIAAVEFTTPVRARTLLPYGNSSQPGSRHRVDQLPLFARREMRPVWRTRAEVEANLASRELLR